MTKTNEHSTFERPKVFVSHSSRDKDAIWPIVQYLAAYGAVPWVDALEMRPGDQLFRRISTAIEGSAYLLAMVSKQSVKSRWVEEEVRQATSCEFYDNRIRVIPCLLDDVELPPLLRNRLYCDFSRGLAFGLAEVLRGIHRDRHIVTVGIDTRNPVRLDEESLRRELLRVLALTSGKQKFFFLVDAIDILEEISEAWGAAPLKGDPMDSNLAGAMRTRNAVPFILPNLSCVLAKVTDVVVEYTGRDAGLVEIAIAIIQRTAMFCFYWLWKHICSVSEPQFLARLNTIDGNAVLSVIDKIDSISDPEHSPSRSIEAYVLDCAVEDLLYLGLHGGDGVFNAKLDVPPVAIPRDTLENYLGTYPLPPDSEIPRGNWLRYFVPGIAASNVLECSFSGQYIGHYLDKLGLRKEQYKHFGLE